MSAMSGMSGTGERIWIDPARIRFRQEEGGLLAASWDGRNGTVAARLLFPITHTDSAIWIGEPTGEEWGVLLSLDGMESASRAVLEGELRLSPYLPRIKRITALRRQLGQFHWEVATDRGPFAFQTGPLYEAVTAMPGGQRIVTDACGQRFLLPEERRMNGRTGRRLAKWL
ncbi:DUF1854 domain-containing protein [Cohnella lubricantis]|uniref:DUF1854 domain-containing protein n=1 Tax=Cohnella lubricantis TaxID=2163172 RepID=A0A841TC95_9BACL|nr:DUF1854 domain-containing protein [Cohnella lubricantis]MBB6676860.1 DUF1854 domain-containing protein [Cohnella lubricantis]MBP2119440.1 hypothetical protein [Cohnella lubricantis]